MKIVLNNTHLKLTPKASSGEKKKETESQTNDSLLCLYYLVLIEVALQYLPQLPLLKNQ
jgi:hypothetical protein